MVENQAPILDILGIKKLLPHRYPFLLVDKVTEFTAEKSLTAIKNVTANEEFFNGHFPNYPIMPGVLIIEAIAQASALFFLLTNNVQENNSNVFFMSINSAKFRKPVLPGDTLEIKVTPEVLKSKICKTQGLVYVNNTLVCEANITATMT